MVLVSYYEGHEERSPIVSYTGDLDLGTEKAIFKEFRPCYLNREELNTIVWGSIHNAFRLLFDPCGYEEFFYEKGEAPGDRILAAVYHKLVSTAKTLDLPPTVVKFITDPVDGQGTVGLGRRRRRLAVAEALSRWNMVTAALYCSDDADASTSYDYHASAGNKLVEGSDLKGKAHVNEESELDGDGLIRGSLGGEDTDLGILNCPQLAGAAASCSFSSNEFDHCEEFVKNISYGENMNCDYYDKDAVLDGMDFQTAASHVAIDIPKEEDHRSNIAVAHNSWALSEPAMQVIGQAAGAGLSQVMTNGTPGTPWLKVTVKTATLVGFSCTFAAVGFMRHHRVLSPKLSHAMAKFGAITTASAVILSMGMALPAALGLPLGMAASALVAAAVILA